LNPIYNVPICQFADVLMKKFSVVNDQIEIIEYDEKYHEDFKKLNLEWLDKYNLTESHDLMVLNDPKGTILDHGGFIWLAKAGDEIIGSAALMNEGHGIFELAKMSVTPNWQGKGISKTLIEVCLKRQKR
jgi:GNAT superfamily N-acetyltransferase